MRRVIGPLYLWLLPVCLSDSLLVIDSVTAVITHILLLISIAHSDRHRHNVFPCPVSVCVFLDLVLQIRPQLCVSPFPSCLNFDSFTAKETQGRDCSLPETGSDEKVTRKTGI